MQQLARRKRSSDAPASVLGRHNAPWGEQEEGADHLDGDAYQHISESSNDLLDEPQSVVQHRGENHVLRHEDLPARALG